MVLDRNLSEEDPGDPQGYYVPALGLAGPLARVLRGRSKLCPKWECSFCYSPETFTQGQQQVQGPAPTPPAPSLHLP